jgi:2-keto-3-deoxy-L-rhamnonate aldolase RhmA
LAESAVALTKYPPLGERNVGIARAQGYGIDFDAYVRHANDWICTILQIEHIQAVENIEAILSIPGVDALVIGPYDLSASLGMPGKVDAPEVSQAIDRVLHACRQEGKPIGIFAADGDRAHSALEQGFNFIVVGIDVMLLASAASSLIDRLRSKD